MKKPIAVFVGLLLLLMLLLFSTTYTVKYNEVAIKATFGEADASSVIRDAGLHWRLPVFIDKVTKLDTRLQLVESPLEEITTSDGLQIVVRAFMLWRVDTEGEAGPLDFFLRYTTTDNAQAALQGQFRTAFTGALSTFSFADLIGDTSRLPAVEANIKQALAANLAANGVSPVAVGISQIVLPPKTSSAVLSRMQATRDLLADAERQRGRAEAETIRAEGNTQADKIRAFATQRAEEIRARAEREAARYLEQMSQAEDLAIFLVWLDTLERTLDSNTTIVLPANGFSPFHLLDPKTVTYRNAIPFPTDEGDAPRTAGTPLAAPLASPERATPPPAAPDREGDS